MLTNEISHSVWIGRRPDEVFAFLLDARSCVRWQAGVLDSWHSPEGPPAVGTRVHQVRDLLGRRVEAVLEIVELDAPARSVVRGAVGPLDLTARYDLAGEAGGTRLLMAGRVGGAGPLVWLRPVAQRELGASARLLKSILEYETSAGLVAVSGRSGSRGGS